MPSPDIASAARRLAETYRPFPATTIDGTHVMVETDDLASLIPILDALAAMPEPDEARVERWARAMCVDVGVNPDGQYGTSGSPWWTGYTGRAEQAIALADAERVAREAGRVDA